MNSYKDVMFFDQQSNLARYILESREGNYESTLRAAQHYEKVGNVPEALRYYGIGISQAYDDREIKLLVNKINELMKNGCDFKVKI